jgi:hypothetical protein
VLDSAGSYDGKLFRIDLPDEFIAAHRDEINVGVTVCIPGGVAKTNPNRIVVSSSSSNGDAVIVHTRGSMGPKKQRLLAQTTGTSYALAIRVKSSKYSEEPGPDLVDLQGRIFGLGARRESVNIATQFELCSKGKFRIQPTTTGQVSEMKDDSSQSCPIFPYD